MACFHIASAQVTDTGGNVGIGNPAPAHKLDVNGDLNLSLGSKVLINSRPVVSTVGTGNTFIGDLSGNAITTGYNNAFIGYKAGEVNTAGHSNAFIGFKAGELNTSGFSNAFIGQQAGRANTTGKTNVMIGRRAGFTSATGDDNVFIGHLAGQSSNGGSSNTYLGSGADGPGGLLNATAIGANASVTQDSSLVLGDNAKVGIGTSAPSYDLDVVGDVNFSGNLYKNGVLFSGGGGATGPTGPAGATGPQGATGPAGSDANAIFGWTAGVVSNENGDNNYDDFVFGSPSLNYDSVYSHSTRFFFDKGRAAFRTGESSTASWDQSNLGYNSFASGENTTASGNASTAFGYNNVASGSYSTATGYGTAATGSSSTAMGRGATATGSTSTAIGYYCDATNSYASAIGHYCTASGTSSAALGHRSEASGSSSMAFGYYAEAIGDRSFSFGYFNRSNGLGSFATGKYSYANGEYSFSGGDGSRANGDLSMAIGNLTYADGEGSFTTGYRSDANGDYASAFGYETDGSTFAGMAIGRYNVGNGNDTMWVDTDPLFEVGNGTSSSSLNRNNAFTVLKNGNVGINDATPDYDLDVEGDMNFTGNLYQNGALVDLAGLPSGTSGQTIHHNGSDWVATSNLKNNGNTVNIGDANTNSSVTKLAVDGSVSSGTGVTNLINLQYDGTQSSGSSTILNMDNNCTGSSSTHMGIYNQLNGTSGHHRGVYHYLTGATSGSKTGAYASILNGSGSAYGFNGSASGTGTNYGLYGSASGGTTNWAGYFAGSTYSTGTYQGSDVKLKRNVEEIESALELVSKLSPSTYEFRTDEFKALHLEDGQRFGFIAHELKEVLPQFVKANKQEVYSEPDKDGNQELVETIEFDVVNYTEFIPILTAAIQEQQEEIESLKAVQAENEELKNRLDRLEEMMASFGTDLQQCCLASSSDQHQNSGGDQDPSTGSEQAIDGSDAPSLEQNSPNPFRDNTVIKYYLPEVTGSAQLQISNLNGAVLKTFNLQGIGFGQVLISGGSFDAGTYIYSLIVDGKRIDSKRMMLF